MTKHKFVLLFFIIIFSFAGNVAAQPFLLKSVGETKPFSLKIYYGSGGKGAFVQYRGQKGIIPLKVKSVSVDSVDQNSVYTYVWTEMLNGKITGNYGLTEGPGHIDHAWYLRKRDHRKFELVESEEANGSYDGSDKFLLHGTIIEFNDSSNDQLIFRYPDGTVNKSELPDIVQPNGGRQSDIADYNFDGYDDVAFSVADAGMGVYLNYIIYLYDSKQHRFRLLEEPDYAKANCSCLCNVTLDKEKKLLFTSCRGGAHWWQDVYRFGKNNKLVWIRSEELN